MRDRINENLKAAMKARDQERLSTLRLISAAIKDRDIAARSEGQENGVGDEEILSILSKMARQRQESATTYEEAGRLELAEKELREITVIEEFLPRQLSDEDITKVVSDTIAEIGAGSIRDMGKVMAALKSRYAGQMDFAKAGAAVKTALG